ncbi:PTS sugar transporter subunit IIB [Clostridium sp. AL.422]|uniref:PTS sugar transporter subunit IIB n=1 Tax=Clostridium TaxID=1485 RepID=UPI00293DADEE|nr:MULTISPECIES: PTS sugar transporter subunit IIB [unclassified Clostridium]MDV4151375.1 PTS sugar transporter subunit IIB [Clostridium sp. AL.422]
MAIDFERLHILLVCNLGASTGIMVAKMREICSNSRSLEGKDIKIDARPAGELEEYINLYDVILVGPQMRHKFRELKEIADFYKKPIEIINSQDYGLVNGGNILKAAILLRISNN